MPLRLGLSYRRALLDDELTCLAPSFAGVVLDVGGRRPARGCFAAPVGQTKLWVIVNLAVAERPDVVADAAILPVRTAAADWVLCLEVLQYVERPESVLGEIARVLAPGGRAVLSTPFLHRADTPTDRHRFTAVELRELAERVGLRVERLVPQGLFFTTLANAVRQAAAHIDRRPLRAVAAALVVPLAAAAQRLDGISVVRRSAFLSSFSTGFLVVMVKG